MSANIPCIALTYFLFTCLFTEISDINVLFYKVYRGKVLQKMLNNVFIAGHNLSIALYQAPSDRTNLYVKTSTISVPKSDTDSEKGVGEIFLRGGNFI